jgi:AAA+ ATPase superfamily predicted ATPase
MPNPFLFGKIVTGEHFCNREEEKLLLEENLKGGQSVMIISPRRMGKSSLLAVVTEHLETLGLKCGRIDYFALNSVSKIVGETIKLCAEMILRQENSIERFLAMTGSIFKRTRIAIEPSPDGACFSVKPTLSLPVEIRESLTEGLIGLDDFMGKKGKKGILVMDEFQEIASVDRLEAQALEAEFRTAIQSTKNLSFAFLGSQASLLSDMFTDRNRPFFQSAKIIKLGSIDRKSLGSYIETRFKSVGFSIENVTGILDLVHGHPDYAQRICSHLFDIVSSSKEKTDSVSFDNTILNLAMKRMIEACSLFFIPEWETYTFRQQQVLSLLAENGPLKRVPAIYLAEYEMSHTTFNTALKELIRKGTVRVNRQGQYELSDPIFARWIMRR